MKRFVLATNILLSIAMLYGQSDNARVVEKRVSHFFSNGYKREIVLEGPPIGSMIVKSSTIFSFSGPISQFEIGEEKFYLAHTLTEVGDDFIILLTYFDQANSETIHQVTYFRDDLAIRTNEHPSVNYLGSLNPINYFQQAFYIPLSNEFVVIGASSIHIIDPESLTMEYIHYPFPTGDAAPIASDLGEVTLEEDVLTIQVSSYSEDFGVTEHVFIYLGSMGVLREM